MRIGSKVLVLLIILICAAILQYLLSRTRSKWIGLILPGISFLISLIALLEIAVDMSMRHVLLQSTLVLVIFNIPTIVFLAIYSAGRDKVKKMNIQDQD